MTRPAQNVLRRGWAGQTNRVSQTDRRGLRCLSALAVATLMTLLLAACGSDASDRGAGSGALRVVAAENFWGDITSQLGGTAVSVTSILSDPNTDPHEYESSAKNAAAVARAALVITNGVGYDSFMQKLMKASPSGSRHVVNVEDVVKPAGENPNPHLWYQPGYVLRAATAIEAELAELVPAQASTFKVNLARFAAAERSQVVDVIDQIKAKYQGEAIAYTERVPGYLIEAAGLTLGVPATFAQSIEDGNDPSPGDERSFESALTDHRVKVLLYNAQVTSPATERLRALAKSNAVPVLAVTETLPPGARNFQTWQGSQARALLEALGG
ncbi:zinc/manganese transport system substrate-binding protein [Jatrophihabitans sp. GAS493]|uniref:metal ABC transporter solute-binding protein, Zn/Mn family n=1 Tax=Jatrophihabitans sp. GAS493 TaxID=1907575 RepID=UPI000BBF9BAA|nr:zinc ABC transporter substrate-binding protein [Jatrophihabitans sp. GAS493]SOD74220.1 zinc/manganese transport system substrate-binding protein [Jatrophihabitans sp. GAS493]